MVKALTKSALICLCLFTTNAAAIVNIEKVNIEKNPAPFQGQIDFKLSGASGNSDIQSSSLGSRFQWNETSTQFIVLKYNYARSFDVKSKDNSFMHYRYIVNPKLKITSEYFLQLEENEFTLLKLRTLFGAGLRFSLLNNIENQQIRFGLGLFRSKEKIDDTNNTIDELNRLNTYLTYQYKIKDSIHFLSTTYYQPDIDNTSDYRILEQLSLEFSISKNFVYYLTIDMSYDSDPVIALDELDKGYKSGIKYIF